ncbi:hypothetical protein FHT74_001460 [Rhizobium sp. BK109]|nr:hypothetical protein [Rhizobium sp. BK112]MBB4177670.1 hypothetical protein [Rhizobium sp. BK109]
MGDLPCEICGPENSCICQPCQCKSCVDQRPESPLARARRLTQDRVDAGELYPWVMGDPEQRDRLNQARDRRSAFHVVPATCATEDRR